MKLILLIALLFIGLACNPFTGKQTIIRLMGSDTMQPLARAWAVDYMETHPNVSVYVEGGGSATGFKGLAAGSADIALASRLINSSEVRLLGERYQQLGVSFLVAKDALSVYLNPANPVRDLTMEQIQGIFSGTLINWNQLGGLNEKIIVTLRPPTSGSYYYFKSHVLNNDSYAAQALTLPTTSAVASYVANHRNAIGYGGIGYRKNILHAHLNGIAAEEDNVRLFKYPLTRYLYLYTPSKPGGPVKDFIDWVLSPAGQKIVRRSGYIPLWESASN